jgi:phosphate transport system substrate-binding protein
MIICVSVASGQSAPTSVQLRGSGTVMGVIERAAEAYMAEHEAAIVLCGGGTDRAIKSLIDGTCQIAMASADPNTQLEFLANKENITLAGQTIAFDAIVPFVHPDNPVSGLTLDQLSGIFSGEIANWSEVGGNDAPIVLVSRDTSSGTFEGFKHLVLGNDAILPVTALKMESIPEREYVAANPNAIGFASFSYVDSSVKPLAIDGAPATDEAIRTRTYPLTRDLKLYIRNDASVETTDFIQYVLANISDFVGAGIYPAP